MVRIRSGVEFRRLGEEGVIFDPLEAKFYRLSPKATSCWEAVVAERTHDDDEALHELSATGLLQLEDADVPRPSGSLQQVVESVAFVECACSVTSVPTLPTNQGQCRNAGCIWTDPKGPCVRP